MFSEQLKALIRSSGIPPYRIAKETGIPQATLSRFLSEDPDQHRDIRLEATVDRLAEYLGLAITVAPASPPKPRKVKKPGAPKTRSR